MPSSAPVSLYVSDFEDERGRVEYYWPRLQSLDVPVPKTTFAALEATDDGYRWDTDAILEFVERNDFHRAFVRTQFKAATVRLREGSFIPRPDPETIDRTVESLLNQNDEQGWPHGGSLVVREWLDLDWCRFPAHSCHPSVRFFVDDGEVLGWTPANPDASELVCAGRYDYLGERLAAVDFETPRRYAERVAAEFSEATWGVDFALDTRGDWYCTEFNFNGIYWNRREERWWDMCGQGDFEPFGPTGIHSAALWGVRPEEEGDRDGRWW
jgi:hypothetical protein